MTSKILQNTGMHAKCEHSRYTDPQTPNRRVPAESNQSCGVCPCARYSPDLGLKWRGFLTWIMNRTMGFLAS